MRLSSGQPMVCCTKPALVLLRRDLPQLLQADAEFLRIPILPQAEALDQYLRKVAARAFGQQGVSGAQLHAAGEAGFCCPSLATPMSPVATPVTAPLLEQHLGRGKAGIDLDAERLRLPRQIAADIAERDDEVAVIAHQRRQQQIRQPERAGRAEQ